MAFRSISTNNVEATSLVITAPSGIVDGDILIAFAHSDDVLADVTCTGFTILSGTPLTTTTDSARTCVLYKKAASESGNYTLVSDAGAIVGGIAVFSGRDPTNYLHRSSTFNNNTADATPWDLPGAAFGSVTSEECDILVIGASDNTTGAAVSHTAPSGHTMRGSAQDTTDGLSCIALSSQDAVAAGATGALTMVGTSAGNSSGVAVVVIALMKAASTEFDGLWELEEGDGYWELEDGTGFWAGETYVDKSLPPERRDRRIVPLI